MKEDFIDYFIQTLTIIVIMGLIVVGLTSCQTVKVSGSVKSGSETLAKVEIEGVAELCASIRDPEGCITSIFKDVNAQLKSTIRREK